MKIYTTDDMNTAIHKVETAKQSQQVGWGYLEEVGLKPADDFVAYALLNAKAHGKRLSREDDISVIYATGWLQGLSIGAALPK